MSLLLRMSFLPWQNLLIITFSYTFQTNANKSNQWWILAWHYFVWLFDKTMAKLFWLHSISSMETKNSLPCTQTIAFSGLALPSDNEYKVPKILLGNAVFVCDRGIWCALCIILCDIYYCVALSRCRWCCCCCCLRLNVPSYVWQYRRVEWILVFYALHLSVFLHIALHHKIKCHAKRIQCIFQLEWVHSSQIQLHRHPHVHFNSTPLRPWPPMWLYLLPALISIRFAQNVHIDIIMDKMFETLYIKYNHEAPIHSLKIVILARLNVKMYFPFLYRILPSYGFEYLILLSHTLVLSFAHSRPFPLSLNLHTFSLFLFQCLQFLSLWIHSSLDFWVFSSVILWISLFFWFFHSIFPCVLCAMCSVLCNCLFHTSYFFFSSFSYFNLSYFSLTQLFFLSPPSPL